MTATTDAGDWTPLLEALLSGVVHASNNRFTTLLSLAQLAELDGNNAEDISLMRTELTRLHEVVTYVGLLVAPAGEPEALELEPLLEIALAIHSLHPRTRAVSCTVKRSAAHQVVRAPRSALLRLLLLLVDIAKRGPASAESADVILDLAGDDHVVRLGAESTLPPGTDALKLATACGATLQTTNGGLVLELPSLAALRMRERANATRTPASGA